MAGSPVIELDDVDVILRHVAGDGFVIGDGLHGLRIDEALDGVILGMVGHVDGPACDIDRV